MKKDAPEKFAALESAFAVLRDLERSYEATAGQIMAARDALRVAAEEARYSVYDWFDALDAADDLFANG